MYRMKLEIIYEGINNNIIYLLPFSNKITDEKIMQDQCEKLAEAIMGKMEYFTVKDIYNNCIGIRCNKVCTCWVSYEKNDL